MGDAMNGAGLPSGSLLCICPCGSDGATYPGPSIFPVSHRQLTEDTDVKGSG